MVGQPCAAPAHATTEKKHLCAAFALAFLFFPFLASKHGQHGSTHQNLRQDEVGCVCVGGLLFTPATFPHLFCI